MTPRLWLLPDAHTAIRDEAARHTHDETGGMLLGYRNGPDIVVTGSIGPGPRAARTPTSFLPDGPWQEAELARAYADSGRTHTYLGDWHTHPGGIPALSRTDRRTLTRTAAHRPARQPTPLSAILAPDPDGLLAFWLHTGRWTKPVLVAAFRC